MSERLISLNQVGEVTSLSRTQINKLRKMGLFPAAVEIEGSTRVAFVRSEVEAWIDERIARRNARRAA
jgi:prophage regulatory protein